MAIDVTASSLHPLISLETKRRLINPTDNVRDICVIRVKFFLEEIWPAQNTYIEHYKVQFHILNVSKNMFSNLSDDMHGTEPHVNN